MSRLYGPRVWEDVTYHGGPYRDAVSEIRKRRPDFRLLKDVVKYRAVWTHAGVQQYQHTFVGVRGNPSVSQMLASCLSKIEEEDERFEENRSKAV